MESKLKNIMNSEYSILFGHQATEKKTISIVIPTYKRQDLLVAAIESVLNQNVNLNHVELIILSNDPNDDLRFIIDEYNNYNILIIRNNENLGMCGNINKALFVARGEYIAYLHDDDLLTPNYVEVMLNTIKKHPDADCIIPARYVLNSDTEWGMRMQKKQLIKLFVSNMFFLKKLNGNKLFRFDTEDIYKSGRNCFSAPTCGTLFKREKIIAFNGFDSIWKYAFDFILFEEFCKTHKVYLLKKPLGVYRMEESASNRGKVQLEFFEAQKYCLDKNRSNIKRIKKNYYEYIHLFYKGLSCEAQKLIDNKYPELMNKWKRCKYILLRFRTELFYYSSGIETERFLSKKRKNLLIKSGIL